MHPSTPLLSVIIPTRNRIPFCISAIESILNISDPRLELVIQDNSDTNELEEYVKNRKSDNRLKYRYTTAAFSTIDNFNAGMELSTGEYVCFIGDDDGINPEIIDAAAWAQQQQIDALAWNIKATYLWPGTILSSTLFTNVTGGRLMLYHFTGKITKINQEEEIKKFLRKGGSDYLKFALPKVYHGMVSRSCFNKVKVKTGNYFGGLSPDIFSSLAIALVAENTYVIDYPLSIAGSCPVAEQTHNSKEAQSLPLEKAPHLKNRGHYIWNEIVPAVYSGNTIQLDSGLNALTLMGRNDLISSLNIIRMSACFIMAYPQFKEKIIEHAIKLLQFRNINITIGKALIKYESVMYLLKMLFLRGGNRFLLILGIRETHTFEKQDTIVTATKTLAMHLNNSSLKLSDLIKEAS